MATTNDDIHITIVERPGDGVIVWIDVDGEAGTGVVIGLGDTREAAIADAKTELTRQLVALDELAGEPQKPPTIWRCMRWGCPGHESADARCAAQA